VVDKLFRDLVEREISTTENDLEMECIWFCFSHLIQKDLDEVKDSWNTHYIRRFRHETIPERPDELYHLPEWHNAQDFLQPVNDEQRQHVLHIYPDFQEVNEYEVYFKYVMDLCDFHHPVIWNEALELYNNLLEHAIEH
jgi:hypothetical protein